MTTICVKDFCTRPGPALMKDGKFSGEEFRETILRPAFDILYETVRNDSESKECLYLDLTGVYGYSNQWLEEVFSGMVLFNTYPESMVFGSHVMLESEKEPYLINIIQNIVNEAITYVEETEKKSQKNSANNRSEKTGNGNDNKPIICANNYMFPCWCCEHSPDFKGPRIRRVTEVVCRHNVPVKTCDMCATCIHGVNQKGLGCDKCAEDCTSLTVWKPMTFEESRAALSKYTDENMADYFDMVAN